jgi:hypothetical protein
MSKIDQIVETLRVRGENPEYIISYLTKIISGLQAVAPNPVKGYLDVTIHNMTPVKNSDDTYDEYGVNTKNSFNTPPKK